MSGRVTQDIPYALIPRWVIEALGLDLSAIAVYAALAGYASRLRQAFPGVRTVAQELGCSPTTVQSALGRLERSGAVVVQRRWNGGRRRSNLYRLVADPMEAARRAAKIAEQAVDNPVDNPVDNLVDGLD